MVTDDALTTAVRALSRGECEGLIRWTIGVPGVLHRWIYRAAIREIQGRPIPPFTPTIWSLEEVRENLKLLGECCPHAGTYNYPAIRELWRQLIDILLDELKRRAAG